MDNLANPMRHTNALQRRYLSTLRQLLPAMMATTCLLAVWPSAASALQGPCGVGAAAPTCNLWNGKVTFIGDGDTMSVDLFGHKGEPPVHVRITGIQAMEETFYTDNPDERTGECHANEATARLEHLVKVSKGRVQLAAMDRYSTSRGRQRRQVRVLINGTWRDVGRILVGEGLALAMPNSIEWAWNASYTVLAERAAEKRIGLYNTFYCGIGPDPAANLRVWVNSDAEGSDRRNPNGEWVKIKNGDPVNPVPVGGWWVRDSDLRRYTLPPTATVPPGGAITVYVGEGVDEGTDYFWNLTRGVFDNASRGGHGNGDGAYLFDPEGDLRAWMIYPCRYNCVDPYQGAVKVTGHPRGSESVSVENIGASPIDLEGYQLTSRPHSYAFPAGSVLQPGETLKVKVRGSPAEDTPTLKHWDMDGPILGNDGDSVKISTFTDIVLACDAWGSASCSP
jgi:endonuclease YncB( thermonuclease family)